MYLDVKVRLSNKFWARYLVDTVAMWLKCNSTPPFRVDSGSNSSRGAVCRGAPQAAKDRRPVEEAHAGTGARVAGNYTRYLADVRRTGEAKKAVAEADFIPKPKIVKRTGTAGD